MDGERKDKEWEVRNQRSEARRTFMSTRVHIILIARNRVLRSQLSCQNGSRPRDAPQSAPPRHARPAGCVRILSRVLARVYDGQPRCAPATKKRKGGAHRFVRRFFSRFQTAGTRQREDKKEEIQPRIEHGSNTDSISILSVASSGLSCHSCVSWFPASGRSPPIAKPMKNKRPQDVILILSHFCLDPVFFARKKPVKTRRLSRMPPATKCGPPKEMPRTKTQGSETPFFRLIDVSRQFERNFSAPLGLIDYGRIPT